MKIRQRKKSLRPLNAVRKVDQFTGTLDAVTAYWWILELLRRQKEISKGKLSKVYQAYISAIPRWVFGDFRMFAVSMVYFWRKCRTRQHPRTPCKYAKMSRRGFDGAIKAWRRKLHEFGADKYVPLLRSSLDHISPLERKKTTMMIPFLYLLHPNEVMVIPRLHPLQWAWRKSLHFYRCFLSRSFLSLTRDLLSKKEWDVSTQVNYDRHSNRSFRKSILNISYHCRLISQSKNEKWMIFSMWTIQSRCRWWLWWNE